MVCTRNRLKLNKRHKETLDHPTTTNILEALISALESAEGIKSRLLESSYHLLIQLSSKQQVFLGRGADINVLFVKTNKGEVRLSLRDLYRLSSILFKELQKRLKQLHSSKHDVSANSSLELEEINLLIRCCMVTLTFQVPQEHLLESGLVLLLIIKKLSLLEIAGGCDRPVNVKKLLSCQCMYSGVNSSDSFTNGKVASLSSLELFDPCIPSIISILEVLLDELLVHGQLRKYLQMINSFSPTNERLFKHDSNCGDFGIIMEIMCSHFSLSIYDSEALHGFLNTITWVHNNNFKGSEMSMISAKTLLQNPPVLSAPKLLQAHIVSLVSNVISVGLDSKSPKPDPRLLDCYLSVFESSVNLYTQHMSILKTKNHPIDGNIESFQPSFASCIDPTKAIKLNHLMIKLNDSWNSNLRSKFSKTKSDLLASCIEYVHNNQCLLGVKCRKEVLSFLNCILLRAANDVENIELPLNGDASLQDISLLASLSMLMSNSLVQAVWCIRNQCHKSLKVKSFCKEYDFIVGVISCFKEFNIRLPIQKFSYTMMETHPLKHKESRLMLFHFLGLLSLSFDSGLDFLVKSCVSMVMVLTNLFLLEEGNVDALTSLANPTSLPYEGSLAIYKEEALICQYPTRGVVAKFQKIRTLYVSKACVANDSTRTEKNLIPFSMERSLEEKKEEEEEEETCGGEIYLKSRLEESGNGLSDFDDLADFVECKKGKDYVDWLKGRERFREWKLTKRAKLRWEKKKQAWRSSSNQRKN